MVKAILSLGLLFIYLVDKISERLFGSEWICSHGRINDQREAYIRGYNWGVFRQLSGDVDVIPLGDREDHDLGDSCKCSPRVDLEGANLVIVHNAFDYREIAEEAARIINGEAEE